MYAILALFTFVPLHSISTISDQEIRTALKGSTPRDAQLFLNWAYWSFKRSHATLQSQEIALKSLQENWALWQNLAQTRRNPEKALPYPAVSTLNSAELYRTTYAQQMAAQTTYAFMLNKIIKEPMISTFPLNNLIITLRAQARAVVTQVATSMATTAHEALATLAPFAHKNFFTDQLQNLIDGLGMQSFSTFDRKYTETSDYCFKGLLKSQELGNSVWHAVETARAEFYFVLFKRIQALMVELQFPAASFTHAFTANGLSATSQQLSLPSTL